MNTRTYRDEARRVLKDLCIYRKLTPEERDAFNNAKTEIQIDNLLTTFRRKYL